MIKLRTDFPPTPEGARDALNQVWGFSDFRPAQQQAIGAVLSGRDVLAILPTGGGKSLLYQIPALLGKSPVLVVSPLIALMHDQVARLQEVGIPAIALDGSLGVRRVEQALIDARYGKYKILYLTPERLTTELFQAYAPDLGAGLLAVDEAHCVSEWAPHFRPSYRTIPEARALLGNPPVLAVTATATPEVRRDIEALLALRDPEKIVQGFERPSLSLTVLREDNKRARVLEILGRIGGAGIVYASTRRDAEAWAGWLESQGVGAAVYHGGMEKGARAASADRWMKGKARVMVATNAFGMGIDRPDVRFVVHVDVPASLEAYYQEAGRAGRDGAPAHAVLLWQPRDLETQQTLRAQSHPTRKQLAAVFDAVGNLGQVAVGTLPAAPLTVAVEKVAQLAGAAPALVRNAFDVLERAEALRVEVPQGDGQFRWLATRDALLSGVGKSDGVARFIAHLVRALPREAFLEDVDVSLGWLGRGLKLPPARVARGLAFLEARGLARWQPHGEAVRVMLTVPRSARLSVQDEWLDRARDAAERRFAYLQRYLTASVCRRRFVLGYFGQDAPDRCGQCDVCRRTARASGPLPGDEPTLKKLLDGIAATSEPADFEAHERTPVLLAWLVAEGYARVEDVLAQRYALTADGERYRARLSPR